MLASISPVGEASRHQRWTFTVTAYVAASSLGGAFVGAVAGVVGSSLARVLVWPDATVLVTGLALLALLGVALDRGRFPLRLPSWQRQVDERWLTTYRGWVYGAGFGFQLGAAVLTRVPTSATYVALAAAVATRSVGSGTLIGLVFGTVRGLPVLLTAPLRDPERLRGFHRRLDAATPIADRATRAVVGTAAVAAAAVTLLAA